MRHEPAVLKRTLLLVLAASVFALASCEQLMGYKTPEWTSVAKSRDGRQFVTDGKIAMDVELAQPKALPTTESPAWFGEALDANARAERRVLFSIADIKPSQGNPEIVVAPGGMQLEESHVTYLQLKYASSYQVGLWQQRSMQPVVVVINGQAVGAFKPISQP